MDGRVNVEYRSEGHGKRASGQLKCLECGDDLGRGHRVKAARHVRAVHPDKGELHMVQVFSREELEGMLAARQAKRILKTQQRTAKRRQVSSCGTAFLLHVYFNGTCTAAAAALGGPCCSYVVYGVGCGGVRSGPHA